MTTRRYWHSKVSLQINSVLILAYMYKNTGNKQYFSVDAIFTDPKNCCKGCRGRKEINLKNHEKHMRLLNQYKILITWLK